MSRKRSTLFSYFKPVQEKSSLTDKGANKPSVPDSERENKAPSVDTTPTTTRKRPPVQLHDEDSEGEIGGHKNLSGRRKRIASMSVTEKANLKKRKKRIFESSDESGEDDISFNTDVKNGIDNEREDTSFQVVEEIEITPARKKAKSSSSTPKTPRAPKTPKTPRAPKTPKTPAIPTTTPTSTPTTPITPTAGTGGASNELDRIGSFPHEKLEFLTDEHRRDKNGKRVADPEFCQRTVLVPSQFLKKQTPAMRQWWEIKSENFDTVLFFKVGKFYELYHMDAVIGVKELHLTFMRGEFAHAGFPEIAFGRYSQTLVQKGYRVARVEQTETPQMMEERVRSMVASPSRFDRVVCREVCALISKGTRTIGFFEGETPESESSYLLALKEKADSCTTDQYESEFGVCFIDTCIGTFHLGQFKDDRHCSRLRTLLAHYPPVQVVTEKGNLSYKSSQLVNQMLSSAVRDILISGSEFWDAKKTLKFLSDEEYFEKQIPEVLQRMLSEEDSIGMSPLDEYQLAISSFGACIWTLKRSLIENDLLKMKQFEEFVPIDEIKISHDSLSCDTFGEFSKQRMVLDDITLANLDVLDNFGHNAGTLLQRIDHCSTAFGRRLLKQWISAPLCSPAAINDRLNAVGDLIDNQSLLSEVKDVLKTLPDLERLIRRIHVMGSKGESHPENRAILFESITYNKRKIKDFLLLLTGFQNCLQIVDLFTSHVPNLSSKLLKKIVATTRDGGSFPELSEQISYFQNAFDHERARKEGSIIPNDGVNKDYDESTKEIKQLEQELQDYLQQQKKRLRCKNIVYYGNGRNRYQLEVPDTVQAPDDYELKSQRKGFFRFRTSQIEQLLVKLTSAEERKGSALQDTMRTIFYSFSEHFSLWNTAVWCISRLDVLVSMAMYSAKIEGNSCRPEVIFSEHPFLDICQGRHPCVVQTFTGGEFIPNNVVINSERGPDGKKCILVTGPNMGGKSTLMRQTGLIAILAQLGCYVPAESCKLSPIDRIFTRLGASDRIMQGESTFFVEVSETSVMLQHSTVNSLILLDELGRGTATYDGTAIATAVVKYLTEDKSCRTLFSTHYHSLVDEFKHSPRIELGHMACMVEGDGDDNITFLYKFVDGACPKSYGFNAAKLAGVPQEVIQIARDKAQEFEKSTKKLHLFRKIMNKLTTPSLIRNQYYKEIKELYT